MKCISLTAPYGTLIALAERYPELGKRIETRSWATTYRGQLAIHQAKGLGPVGGVRGLAALVDTEPFFRTFVHCGLAQRHSDPEDIIQELPLGAIVATCEIVGCEPIGYEWPDNQQVMYTGKWGRAYAGHRLTPQERAFGNYEPGRFAWLLANVKALPEPVPCKGQLGLFNLSPEVLEKLESVQ